MKSTKKIFLTIVISLFVLLVLGVLVLAWRLDDVVKRAVVTVGPQITKTSVSLDSIHIGLMTGSAKVKGFILGNPEGFASSNAISVSVAEVGVNPFTVLSKKIVIRTIHVEGPEITFEGNPFSGNNFSKLLENVNGTAKAGGPPMTNTTAKAASKPAPKIEVDEFFITGARVHIVATGTTIPLPEIHLTDLGKGTDGITITDLSRRVLSAISSATIKAVANEAGNLGKGATDAAGKAATEGVNKVTKGIGGLFKK